eukprot:CFRG7002T1
MPGLEAGDSTAMFIIHEQPDDLQEGMRHSQLNTQMFLGSKLAGKGTLYVLESRLVWWDVDQQKGYTIPYNLIMCHATSRDTTGVVNLPCIYCQLDTDELNEEVTDDEAESDALGCVSELRFAPDDDESLDAIFLALSDCQALHPDEDFNPDDMADQMFTAENLPGTLDDRAMETLTRFDNMLEESENKHDDDTEDQFQDAE